MDVSAIRKKYTARGRLEGATAELNEVVSRLETLVGEADVEAGLVEYTQQLSKRHAALEVELDAGRPQIGSEMAAAKRLLADIDELDARVAAGESREVVYGEALAKLRGEVLEKDEDDLTADALDRLYGPVGDSEPPPAPTPSTEPKDDDDRTADSLDKLFGVVP